MKVKLNMCRLAFPALFEPEQYQNQGPFRFRSTFLFEKDSENHKKLKEAEEAVAKEEWKDDYKKVLDKANDDSKLRFIVDGNKKDYDGYAGMLAVSATRDSSKGRPPVYDTNKNLLAQTDGRPYGGCYVNATVEVWPQNNQHGKTVRAQLLAVQFAKDGDAFGGGMSKSGPDDFENLGDVGSDDDLVA